MWNLIDSDICSGGYTIQILASWQKQDECLSIYVQMDAGSCRVTIDSENKCSYIHCGSSHEGCLECDGM